VNGILTIAHLTWIEARRRRIVLAAVLCGLGFLLLFGLIVYFNAERAVGTLPNLQRRLVLQTLTIVGLYAVNFLVVALAVMLPVDTLSGEIDSGVIQTLASKPVRRAQIVLGKWLVYWLMIAGYIVLMAGGLVALMWLLTGFQQQNLLPALGLMQLEATVLICITMAGGVRLTTITNGIVAFAFYAIAFVGGLVEQVGLMAGNAAARYIGTAISLVSPADALWRKATHTLLPPFITQLQVTPFSGGAVPSAAMVWWGVLFSFVVLALAIRGFNKRAL
jgi:ABC-type transport system involved in multi-copper enzyme maturation permease subunit